MVMPLSPPRRLVETTQGVAAPPHRGVAREQLCVVIDGVSTWVEIVRQRRHFGGTQAFWRCGQCSALRSHLYVVEGALQCRVCGKLDYRSRHGGHPAVLRVAKLRRRLGAAPGLLAPLPRKPRHWRPDYYARLVRELAVIETAIAARLHATVLAVERRRPKP
jgi:hypothetical protein